MSIGTTGIKNKTIVISGGSGFIGSHLCEYFLSKGNKVICVDNYITGSRNNIDRWIGHADFELIEQDICEMLDIDEPIDCIYNLACPASPVHYQADPVHTMMSNVLGTHNLLLLAEQHGACFLQASTSEVYGDPEQHPQLETYWGHVNCTGPRACYDEGKRAAEALCFDFFRAGRVDARVARIFNTYGPRMQPDDGRIISNLLMQALKGQPLTIYGRGTQTRSFCYVSDMVRGLVAMMEMSPNRGLPINLGNPQEFTINELAELVLVLVPTTSKMLYKPLPVDDPQRRKPDISRAREILKWQPRVPLAEGLLKTVAWFSQIADRPMRPRKAAPAPTEARLARSAI